MSKDTSGGSKNLKPKIFGATPLQVGEDDVSRLIGGIVEKGFSQVPQTRPLAPPSAPRPTVLPFPAARHRSHGPHWAPKVGNSNLHNDNDNEDDHTGEEGDFDGMETAADVANPVQRKEKKGLDFSRWREIVEKDAKSANHEIEKGGYSNGMEVGQKDKKMASNGLRRPIIGDWQFLQPIEVFGRGGPAPGVGVGWGASGGGYWSLNTLLGQQDARLLVYLWDFLSRGSIRR